MQVTLVAMEATSARKGSRCHPSGHYGITPRSQTTSTRKPTRGTPATTATLLSIAFFHGAFRIIDCLENEINQYLCLLQGVENLSVEQLVA